MKVTESLNDDFSSLTTAEEEDVVAFTWDPASSSYLLTQAIKVEKDSNPNAPKTVMSAHEFFRIDELEIQAQALDVENTKYTPKLAKDINDLLQSFQVEPEHLASDCEGMYLTILKIPYDILCQISANPKRERFETEFLEFLCGNSDVDLVSAMDAASEPEEEKSARVYFRNAARELVRSHMAIDRSDHQMVEKVNQSLKESATPETFIESIIETLRKFTVYKHIRDMVFSQFDPEERKKFGTRIPYPSFMRALQYFGSTLSSADYRKKMLPFLMTETLEKIVRDGQGDLELTLIGLYDCLEAYQEKMDLYNQEYTLAQQLCLYRYEFIRSAHLVILNCFDKLHGAVKVKPELLAEIPRLQKVLNQDDACWQMVRRS